MRRNFYELATAGAALIASEALKHIAAFCAIEKEIRGRSAEERRIVRQQKSRPPADAFEAWLRAKLALISQKIKLAEAIHYALTRWQGLPRFIEGCLRRHSGLDQPGRSLGPQDAIFAGSAGVFGTSGDDNGSSGRILLTGKSEHIRVRLTTCSMPLIHFAATRPTIIRLVSGRPSPVPRK